jgi:hypothetical protein
MVGTTPPAACRIAVCNGMICAAGFTLMLAACFPGIMTSDTTDVMNQAFTGKWNDWHAPFYTFLFGLLNPSRFGPVGMLLLNNAFLWTATFLFADAARKRYGWLSALVCFIPLSPALVYMPGFIWDVSLHVGIWALAAALLYRDRVADRESSTVTRVVVLVLVVIGVLIRQNGWFAAVPLVFAAMPRTSRLRVKLAVATAFFVAMPLVWTGFAKVTHTVSAQAANSILIHDLGAMSSELGTNLYPGTWTSEQSNEVTHDCVRAPLDARAADNGWDVYAWGRCGFVLKGLREQGIFTTATLAKPWLSNVVHHPVVYALARLKFFATFLHSQNATPVLTGSPSNIETGWPLENRALISAMYAYASSFLSWWVFRPGLWFTCNLVAFCGFAVLGARMNRSEGRAIVSLGMLMAGCSIVWMTTYFVFGVAFDFRYAFWTAYISLVCLVILVGESLCWHKAREASDGRFEGATSDRR